MITATRVVFEAAHAPRRGRGKDAVCTVRTVNGRWMRLEAIARPDDPDNVTVVLHDATASQRAGALAAYFQLTGRERQVVDQLYAGLAANQIGRKLGISPPPSWVFMVATGVFLVLIIAYAIRMSVGSRWRSPVDRPY